MRKLPVELIFEPLEGAAVRLEPFTPSLKEEVRDAVDCDAEAWAIMPINPMAEFFEAFWSAACEAPRSQRLVYAIRRKADARVVGTSTFYMGLADQGGIEIGITFLHPDARAGVANPESKYLMLQRAFGSGAVRVQFRVDTRNHRSKAAVVKLGAHLDGVLRRDRLTWTGYIRDTAYYSILEEEWPAVRDRLLSRLVAVSEAR